MNIARKERLIQHLDTLNKLERELKRNHGEERAERVVEELIRIFEENDLTFSPTIREYYIQYIDLLFSIAPIYSRYK